MKKLLYLLLIILLSNIVTGANIHGTIYTFDLEKRNNSIITINSQPPQTIVSKDGTYSFELDLGKYTINASYSEYGEIKESVIETINIEKQGDYVLDLILFPSLAEEEEIIKEIEEPVVEEEKDYISILALIISIILIIIVVFVVLKYKRILKNVTEEVKKTSSEEGLNKEVLDFIKKQGGRITQKDIRRNFPSSEAKISLIISELEDKGIVKKIKKGRGNVIVLK